MSLAYSVADSLTPQGNPQSNGDGGYVANCPVHGDDRPSLSIWDDDKGSVRVHCHAGCDYKVVKDALVSMGLIPGYNGAKADPSFVPPTPKPKAPPKPSFAWEQGSREEEDLQHIRSYCASRNIFFKENIPVCFRWNSYIDKKTQERVHMVLGAASNLEDKKVMAVQRIFVEIGEDGIHRKKGAKMLGDDFAGRACWFDRKGTHETLMVGEGIETTLSVSMATGVEGVAALSTAGMDNFVFPDATRTLYVLVDQDRKAKPGAKWEAGMAGQRHAVELARRFEASREGRVAYLVTPSPKCFDIDCEKLDFNDLLQADSSGKTIIERFEDCIPVSQFEWEMPPAPDGRDDDDNGGTDDFYPDETLAALTRMNSTYAGVMLAGKFRVIREAYDDANQRYEIEFLEVGSLHNYFANQKYPVPAGDEGIRNVPLSKIWLSWRERRTYDSVVFNPSNNVPESAYNLWRGFAVQPKKGTWELMRKHLHDIICGGNQLYFDYLMAWMARMVQDPGGPRPGVALVLTGGKGIGKGIFLNYFGKIFGSHFMPISSSDGFTGSFNMHLSKCVLVFLDEAVWGGDKSHEGRLKAMITEPTMLFQPKGIDSMALGNHMNIAIASNEDWVVPATMDERRFFVLKVSDAKQQDHDYFAAICDQMDAGGVEAMMHDLLEHDYSGVNLRKAPHTAGLIDQVTQSLDEVLAFWQFVLARGFLLSDRETGGPARAMNGSDRDAWPEKAWKYEIYHEFAQNFGKNRRFLSTEDAFWRRTYKFWSGGAKNMVREMTQDGQRLRACHLPDLKSMRTMFKVYTGIEIGVDDHTPFADQF